MCRLLAPVALICMAPVANATSCNDPNSHSIPNSIVATEIKDEGGRTELYWIIYRDEYCRANRIEVLDAKGQFLAYVTYIYDDADENAHTNLAEVTLDTYAPDGTFLFREHVDGRRLDQSGKLIDNCAFLELAKHLPQLDRRHYERRCRDAS